MGAGSSEPTAGGVTPPRGAAFTDLVRPRSVRAPMEAPTLFTTGGTVAAKRSAATLRASASAAGSAGLAVSVGFSVATGGGGGF
jgi:hypothetical protein